VPLFFSLDSAVAQSASSEKPSDIALINGKIITVDAKDSIVPALSIHNGKIAAIGSTTKSSLSLLKNVRIIDLRGRTATPGLIDSHCHFDETDSIYGIELSAVTSITDAVALVRKAASARKPGEWIIGSGWDEGKLAELRLINSADLDKVAPDNPVWLTHTTATTASQTPSLCASPKFPANQRPHGGTIDRDASGHLTGVSEGRSDGTRSIPNSSLHQGAATQRPAQNDGGLNSEGMTAAKDPGTEGIRWTSIKNS